jgi:hypothetical protein
MCHIRRRIHVSYEEEDTCVMNSAVTTFETAGFN